MGSEVQYTYGAVETFYKGYRFRSRLEARWAAFFDMCKWRWEYEPADFNGWFPDFVLLGDKGNQVFVEVKPISYACEALFDRLMGSGCRDEMLVLGLGPWCATNNPSQMYLGWLCEWDWDGVGDDGCWGGPGWGISPIGKPMHGYPCNDSAPRLDFCHDTGNFTQRMSGFYPGGSWPVDDADLIHHFWGLAHEMTRYDPC
jgi:hypothetical protein